MRSGGQEIPVYLLVCALLTGRRPVDGKPPSQAAHDTIRRILLHLPRNKP